MLIFYIYTQGSAVSRWSLLYDHKFGACASLLVFLQCTVKKCVCQWHLFASVQWLNPLWRRKS